MNIFDFDNCIYKYDSSKKFYFYCLKNATFKQKLLMILTMPVMLFWMVLFYLKVLSAKQFKEKYFSFIKKIDNLDEVVKNFWQQERKNIKEFYLNQIKTPHVIISASPEFLLLPIKEMLEVEFDAKIELIATKLDKVTAKIDGNNCKADEKVVRFKEKFGETEVLNAYSDSLSDYPIFDLASQAWLVDGNYVSKLDNPKLSFKARVKACIKLLRPKHYIKNVLVFIPLFFSGLLFKDGGLLVKCVYGFIALCFACSFVYIINDIADVEADRKHKKKRKRPIASRFVSKQFATVLAVILILGTFPMIWLAVGFDGYLAYLALYSYVIINLLYSFWLKHVALVDVFILAYCYVIRVLFGGLISGIDISGWLYLTIITAALFMGLGKRLGEIKSSKAEVRKVNTVYTLSYLEKAVSIFETLTIAFYSLWVILVAKFSMNWLLCYASIPIVMFIFMRYDLDLCKKQEGDPMSLLFSDILLVLSAIAFVVVMAFAIYF